MLYVNYEWSYDKQYKNIDNIYFAKLNIKFNGNIMSTGALPNKLAGAALQEISGIKNAARIAEENGNRLFSHEQNKFKLKSQYVDPSFIKILDYNF